MSQKQSLLRTEDWLAVWLGFLIIVLVLVGVRPTMPKFDWTTDGAFAATVASSKSGVEKLIADAETAGEANIAAAATVLKAAMDGGERSAIGTAAKDLSTAAKDAQDAGIKKSAGDIGKKIGDGAGATVSKVFAIGNLTNSAIIGVAFLILSAIGIALMGGSIGKYIAGFPIVYVIAWLSQFIAGNSTVKYYGFESALTNAEAVSVSRDRVKVAIAYASGGPAHKNCALARGATVRGAGVELEGGRGAGTRPTLRRYRSGSVSAGQAGRVARRD